MSVNFFTIGEIKMVVGNATQKAILQSVSQYHNVVSMPPVCKGGPSTNDITPDIKSAIKNEKYVA